MRGFNSELLGLIGCLLAGTITALVVEAIVSDREDRESRASADTEEDGCE